ncbi:MULTISPECIES: TetR/AcrR family transcriptional regulator [Bacillus]|uniref:TetR/AcrR family transcriptional regulator n=2 Tax=Bacillus thuringiensis TaxID=1428 RepID=A0AB36TLL7_BACTU|nr:MULTISPECIES: TetR/AcrR family transcriptional regulator [Bacillus cereus group]AHA71937.1 Hemolysin II regulator HlyIIR, TetR family protein [Bacillus thuringiensis YBT-1518]ANC11415.1 TetR family transcriptional regulator [Bacillus cereus]ANC17240.1 TetR family transcriptional regulator [Bacillus cereus]EKS8366971.1 TetR/AcrR family transcriptional regulator [Bacillus cereus]EKS8373090.1 TetR/AcrR family transcriptional regulator [Bacillus cereus]
MGKSREQTIENILEAAKKKFGERGYDGTSIHEIAKEAKVNVAMASYYFNGKENLYLEVFKKYGFGKKLPNFLEETQNNPKTALRQYLTFFITHIKQHPEIGTLAYEEIINESSQLEKIKPYIIGNFEQLKEILLEGKEQGIFYFFSTNHAIYWITSIVLFPKFKKFIDSMNQKDSNDMQTEWITDDLVNRIISSLIHNPTL